jgi:hypothetical protein
MLDYLMAPALALANPHRSDAQDVTCTISGSGGQATASGSTCDWVDITVRCDDGTCHDVSTSTCCDINDPEDCSDGSGGYDC